MLQRIHERITGWIAGVIIALVAGAFVLFGVEYYFQQGAGEQNVAATVNGEKITNEEVNTLYSQMLRRTMMELGGKPVPDAIKQEIKFMSLQSMITNVALLTTLEKEGFRAGMSQVKSMIAQAPEFQENGSFSQRRFEQVLMQVGLAPMAFLRRMQTELIIDQATQGVAASVFLLPNELAHLYRLSHQKRRFGYMIVSKKTLTVTAPVSDKAIRDYYHANQTAYQTPAKVRVDYLVLSPKAIEKSVAITADQAKAYYESNLLNYQIPAHWKVMQVVLPVPSNASANESEKVKTEAEQMAARWEKGEIPSQAATLTLNGAEVSDQLAATLTALKNNQISEPLRTEQGWVLLKMIEATPKKRRPFETVEKNIMAMLAHLRINDIFSKQASVLSDTAYTSPNSLKASASALNLPIQTSDWITKEGEKTGLFSNSAVINAVFSDNVYRDGNNSDPVTLPDGGQVVVRIQQKVASQEKPLAMVRDEIKNLLIQKQRDAQAGVLAYQLQQQLLTGKDPQAIAKEHAITWHSVGMVSQSDEQLKPLSQIASTVFTTPVSGFQSTHHKPIGANTVLLQNGDYAVIAIDQVSDADMKNMPALQQEQLSKDFTTLYSQLLQHYFVGSIVSESKVVLKRTDRNARASKRAE